MGTPTVAVGWVIQDQAAVVPGMHVGPEWLKGQQRSGPVNGGRHNLMFKNVLFHGKGKHALGAIVSQMQQMHHVKVRCGIYPGLPIEKFVESEFGGSMDQVTVEATEDDITRVPYYLYAFRYDKSEYHFDSMLASLASRAVSFHVGNNVLASLGGELNLRHAFEGGVAVYEAVKHQVHDTRSDLEKAMAADDVIVLLTSKEREGKKPVATHRHTHRMPDFAQDISAAVRLQARFS